MRLLTTSVTEQTVIGTLSFKILKIQCKIIRLSYMVKKQNKYEIIQHPFS